ncbi:MAG: methyl-accepting chemotaxis protein [Pseudochelatococcus sp.]|jgi:methyl-accepting chemotaxis protein|uniref:methyl-accepting chemotaxis protein n=1 Tax=Pseudochelatococcus sp. TaxID=2020869 RepID=UPI003D91902D
MNSLDTFRMRFGVLMIGFLWGNAALIALIAVFLDHAPAAVGGIALAAAATAVWWRDRIGGTTRIITSIALACLIALLVSALNGESYQIDVHMYFFASLAVVIGWCDMRALLAYSATVAVHHLLLNYLMPAYVFPAAEPDLPRVLLHAVIVVLQTAVQIWIVSVLQKLFTDANTAVLSARKAEEIARLLANDANTRQDAELHKLSTRHTLAEDFVTRIENLVHHFSRSSHEVAQAAEVLSSTVGEASSGTRYVADVADSAAQSMQTVAAGSEQLAASIEEINRQTSESAEIAHDAINEAAQTQENTQRLLDATRQIGGVLELIRAIAAQTNLLALNATIEAARAGEAGRGFAVVATEVKTLAGRTAAATNEIADKIGEIQQATDETATAISHITNTIDRMRNATSGIAGAVEQQGAATSDIAKNTHRAANDAAKVAAAIVSVSENTARTGNASTTLKELSVTLEQNAASLQAEVRQFVDELKAA